MASYMRLDSEVPQGRYGIYANSDDETDSLERRARDVVRMHGDEDRTLQLLRQGSGCRPFGRHHMMGLIN